MVENNKIYKSPIAIHPGVTLLENLEFLNMSQTDLSERTGLSEKHLSQIINLKSPITPDTAIKLERVLNISASFWNNLQNSYDLTIARLEAEDKLDKEIEEAKKFSCYTELAKLGFVPLSKTWEEKTEHLLRFFGVDSLCYVSNTEAVAFRKTKGDFDKLSLATWLRCGELFSNKIEVSSFDKNKVKEILPELKKLSVEKNDFSKKAQELCASVGIALVYVPYFKNTKVNGAARWINGKPVIQLNTRGAFSDIFWFTLFHEIGHILLHGLKDEFIDYTGQEIDDKEKEADKFSSECLILDKDYGEFIKGQLNKNTVIEFAKKHGIHPGIVVGRLAHEGRASWSKIRDLRQTLSFK